MFLPLSLIVSLSTSNITVINKTLILLNQNMLYCTFIRGKQHMQVWHSLKTIEITLNILIVYLGLAIDGLTNLLTTLRVLFTPKDLLMIVSEVL